MWLPIAKKPADQGAYGGSTFRNPEGMSAWKLVDEAGFRGYTLGGAQVSPKHTNFLINTGDATAEDIERLGERIRGKVRDMTGLELHWKSSVSVPLPMVFASTHFSRV